MKTVTTVVSLILTLISSFFMPSDLNVGSESSSAEAERHSRELTNTTFAVSHISGPPLGSEKQPPGSGEPAQPSGLVRNAASGTYSIEKPRS